MQANSTEFDPAAPDRVIYKLRELKGVDELGGTMRLGAYDCLLAEGSSRARIRPAQISERHRHRYEFNREYEDVLTEHGLRLTGETPDAVVRRDLRSWPTIRGISAANSIPSQVETA